MFIHDNVMYAGITNECGMKLFNKHHNLKTGYVFVRVTDAEVLGNTVTLRDSRDISMYLEILDPDKLHNNDLFVYENGIMYAGVVNEAALKVFKTIPNAFTGKTFTRIHDGKIMTPIIKLGTDYSYYNSTEKFRDDCTTFYIVTDI